MKKMEPTTTVLVGLIGAIITLIVTYLGIAPLVEPDNPPVANQPPPENQNPTPSTLTPPFDVCTYFYPSGWLGDGEQGAKHLWLNTTSLNKPRPNDTDHVCIEVNYLPGPRGWAGIFWQFPENNWGDQPGRKIVGATKIVFWAAGENGGERVAFKAGGIRYPKKPFGDSFETSSEHIRLTKEWKRYEISLKDHDLSNVVGAFAWTAAGGGNVDELTFYLDGIRYE